MSYRAGEADLAFAYERLTEALNGARLTRNAKIEKILVIMKTTILLIALMLSTPAFARIGETTKELDKRYGKPLQISRDKVESRRYSFRGYIVLVGLEQGISQCE